MRPLPLVLATGNPGKVREFTRLLGPAVSLRAMPDAVALPAETGVTFAENARLKALSVFGALGGSVAVLADDSGLEVAALGGRPGVLSARFAGDGAGDEANVRRLLTELKGRPDREARFVCALFLVAPGPDAMADDPETACVVEVEGASEGAITASPRGTLGFGYDPVFQPTGWALTLAEATPEDKDRVSHRGAAARRLLACLGQLGLVTETEGVEGGS